MDRKKKEIVMPIILIAFSVIIMVASIIATRNIGSRQAELTGRFIFDNGCYGVMSNGRLSCIASNIGKKCVNGCYLAHNENGKSCECLEE